MVGHLHRFLRHPTGAVLPGGRDPVWGDSACCHTLLCAALAGIAVCGCSEAPTTPAGRVSHPALTVTSPERAAMLQAGGLGPDTVAIVGSVCDSLYPITSLTLNDVAVPVSGTQPCHAFTVGVESRWGLTVINGEARNSQGTVTRLVQSFLRGPAYFAAVPDSTRIPHGVVTQLNQAAIDDGDRGTPDDLATLLSQALTAEDWNAEFPQPMAISGPGYPYQNTYNCVFYTQTNIATGYIVQHGGVSPGPIGVTSSVVPGVGLRATIILSNLSLPVIASATLDLGCAGWVGGSATGSLTASSVTITATYGISVVGNVPQVVIDSLSTQAAGVNVNVDFAGIAFIGGAVIDEITGALANYIPNSDIGRSLAPQVANLLSDVIAGANPETSVSGVRVDAVVDGVEFPSGAMRIAGAVEAMPDPARPGSAPAHGSLRSDGAPPGFAGSGPAFDFGLGVKDDFVNQQLWAAWQHGTFDLTSASVLGCDTTVAGGTVSLATFAELPPVLMPGAAVDQVAIGLGDMRLTGTVSGSAMGGSGAPLQVTLHASGIAAGTLGVTPSGALTFAVDSVSQAALQIAAIDDSSALESVRAALTPWFACFVEKVAQAGLSHLPPLELDLSGTVVWRVGNAVVAREGSYTTLRGTVVVP